MFFGDDFPMMLEREAGEPDHVPPLAVAFGVLPHENKAKTQEAGRPVYDDKVFVKILVPGDKASLVLQPATDVHKRRFPRAWKAYEDRETTPVSGTPIEQWPRISRGMAWTLKAASILTVEMLAEVHDQHLDKLPSEVRKLRAEAKAYLQQATDSAAVQKLADEKRRQEDTIADLQRQLQDLAAKLEAKTDAAPAPKPRKAA